MSNSADSSLPGLTAENKPTTDLLFSKTTEMHFTKLRFTESYIRYTNTGEIDELEESVAMVDQNCNEAAVKKK